jgi:hypothetical protein
MLADRCQSLTAVDFSAIALERARARLKGKSSVSVSRWNLRSDPIPGTFDLIVVMDVFTALLRPRDSRSARSKLIDAMRGSDYLLVGDHRQNPRFEAASWARFLIRGGKRIVCSFVEDPALETVELVTTETHVLAIFRRK